ncbi:MAG: hypothetical protein BAJATHORv1_10323 [Candidatus Thorarchaeota archaeon]|nr:MAG: hypothetical protein BAJATHORv1_10323 [Candidatus Thorarchaeota archaeon]
MVQIYLSGPIIHKQLRRDDFYKGVITVLERKGHSVFAPQFVPPLPSKEIYERDVRWVRESDFVIAEVSKPSLGVGMELMLAILERIPVLAFFQGDLEMLSRMVRGASGITVIGYSTTDEVVSFLEEHELTSLVVKECPDCESWTMKKTDDTQVCILCNSEISV